jgi:hypothetical protein
MVLSGEGWLEKGSDGVAIAAYDGHMAASKLYREPFHGANGLDRYWAVTYVPSIQMVDRW